MEIESNRIDQPIDQYFKYKPGDVIILPESKRKLFIVSQKKCASIYVRQYPGIGSNAHYYGKITYSPFYISEYSDGKNSSGILSISGGWLEGLKIEDRITIQMTTVLTQFIYKKYASQNRFPLLDVGDYFDSFETIEELADEINRVISLWFSNTIINFGSATRVISKKNLKQEIIKEFR